MSEHLLDSHITEKKWLPEMAVGMSYYFTKHFSVHADFTYLIEWIRGTNSMPNITVGWVSLGYITSRRYRSIVDSCFSDGTIKNVKILTNEH